MPSRGSATTQRSMRVFSEEAARSVKVNATIDSGGAPVREERGDALRDDLGLARNPRDAMI